MSEYDWIIIDVNEVPNRWKCLRCGEDLEQPSQMRLTTATNLMRAFMNSHKRCTEKK